MNSNGTDGRVRWRVKCAHVCNIYILQNDSCFFAARCNFVRKWQVEKERWICKKMTDGGNKTDLKKK